MPRKNTERKTRRWGNVGMQNRGGQSSYAGPFGRSTDMYLLNNYSVNESVLGSIWADRTFWWDLCMERAHTAERMMRRTNLERYREIQGSLGAPLSCLLRRKRTPHSILQQTFWNCYFVPYVGIWVRNSLCLLLLLSPILIIKITSTSPVNTFMIITIILNITLLQLLLLLLLQILLLII